MANEVQKRGERRGEAVEKRPPGEAERDASWAEDNAPLDARTKEPIERPERGRLDRGGGQRGDLGADRRGDTADPEPHDRES
jgi:hypothetical protein